MRPPVAAALAAAAGSVTISDFILEKIEPALADLSPGEKARLLTATCWSSRPARVARW